MRKLGSTMISPASKDHVPVESGVAGLEHGVKPERPEPCGPSLARERTEDQNASDRDGVCLRKRGAVP